MMSSMVAGGGSSADSDGHMVAPMTSKVCEMILNSVRKGFMSRRGWKLTKAHPGIDREGGRHGER